MVQFTKIRLTGFKSFVEPTDLLIEPGVTGVVGPNGCGKSNLVEALRWVMGENSAKRMRGGEMDDVIFSGSATRPARNIAEVVVFLDNRDRTAPAAFNDQDELEVSRRIDRGCGSTYRVNGKEVRAKDVQLLFADAASGAHSTSLVSQGKIGAIINAKATDRRSLLEEAAGITGLHSRRHEAELRLRAAESNLERLDDVISTLESQLHGLKKQARQANRYRNVNNHIRRLEAVLLHLDSQESQANLAKAKEVLEAAERTVGEHAQSAAEAARLQASIAATLPDLRQSEAEAAAALQRLLVDRDNLDRDAARATAAKSQAEQRLAQIERDQSHANAQAADAKAAQDRLSEEQESLKEAAEGEIERQSGARQAQDEARTIVETCEAELNQLSDKVASDEAQAGALSRQITELTRRLERLNAEIGDLRRQRENLIAERDNNDALTQAQAELTEAEAALDSCRTAAEDAAQAQSTARATESDRRQIREKSAAVLAKIEAEAAALTAVLEGGEPDMWPALVDAVTVTAGYETALGAALGDDLSASSDEAAPVHWETLPAYEPVPELPEHAQALSDLVKGPATLTRRLSQIGVVSDEAEGSLLQKQLRPGQRLVTAKGALWRWDGFTAKADAPTTAARRLEQRNRLTELRGQLEAAHRQAKSDEQELERAQALAETAAQQDREARKAQDIAFDRLSKARQRETSLAQHAAAVVSRLAALTETNERLQADLTETETQLAQARTEAGALPPLEEERAKVNELRANLAEKRGQLSECNSQLDRLRRDAEARAQRVISLRAEEASWVKRATDAETHLAELVTRHEATVTEIGELALIPEALAEKREELVELIEGAEKGRQVASDALAVGENDLSKADKALKSAEASAGTAREDRVRAEAGLEQAELDLNRITEAVREQLDCGLADILSVAELDPQKDLMERTAAAEKLAKLMRERDNIGPVNLRAEVEAEELDAQIVGMQEERADLTSAIARLRQGIASLNREGRERLLAAFEKVNGHFSELFVRLFGGGRAHLKLTDADDPLEAGLEIMASPPGKRLQVMSLLSGGEQALTALSLLFAVFLTNPAPICVLDEVDAPLDDANVDRCCSLLEELTRITSTRFMIITHHRMTMARVDRLFGVTMGERGVSQLVSVDLDAAVSLRESA
ncbi:MAG: chromosome segregation protein SMC [Pseudomonadota bacterium]